MAKISQDMVVHMLSLLGGGTNVVQVGNCMTRLRLTLHNAELADATAIRQLQGVLGVIASNEQFQIILGPGKAQTVAENLHSLIENTTAPQPQAPLSLAEIAQTKKRELKDKQTHSTQKFLAQFATIFTPLIPGFIAVGLLLGLGTLIEQQFIQQNSHPHMTLVAISSYMKIFSKGMLTFLSILIGYNAQKTFGGSGVNGAIIATLFILGYSPQAINEHHASIIDFFDHHISTHANVLGVLISAITSAWVEKSVRRFIPTNLDMLLTSTITLLIMGVLTLVLIMPLSEALFTGISWLFLHLNNTPLGSAMLAGWFLFSVILGVHQCFIPVYFMLMEVQGFNSLFTILAMAGAGQVGAAVALYFKARTDALVRSQIKSALIPGLLGVGEPLIYGVTLPRRTPFVTGCLGGACGGFFIGFMAQRGLSIGLNTVFGPSGLVALPLLTSHSGIYAAMAVYAAGLVIAYLFGFLLTGLFACQCEDPKRSSQQ